MEDGAYYHLDEDGNKRYYIGNPIRGTTCNVHPKFFSYMEDPHVVDDMAHIDPEIFKKVVESFKEPASPEGVDK